MAAREFECADAVVGVINAAGLTLGTASVTAKRVILVTKDLESLPKENDAPLVQVVTTEISGSVEEGGRTWKRDYTVVITIQKVLDTVDADALETSVEALCLLCQQIELLFAREADTSHKTPKKLSAIDNRSKVEDYQRPDTYDMDALHEEGRFASEVQVTVSRWF